MRQLLQYNRDPYFPLASLPIKYVNCKRKHTLNFLRINVYGTILPSKETPIEEVKSVPRQSVQGNLLNQKHLFKIPPCDQPWLINTQGKTERPGHSQVNHFESNPTPLSWYKLSKRIVNYANVG